MIYGRRHSRTINLIVLRIVENVFRSIKYTILFFVLKSLINGLPMYSDTLFLKMQTQFFPLISIVFEIFYRKFFHKLS